MNGIAILAADDFLPWYTWYAAGAILVILIVYKVWQRKQMG